MTVETGPAFGRSEICELWDGTDAAGTLEFSVPAVEPTLPQENWIRREDAIAGLIGVAE